MSQDGNALTMHLNSGIHRGEDVEYGDVEASLRGHQADYNFSSNQLEWMHDSWGKERCILTGI
ncbi:hypothetical protein PMIN03_011813 [Paraphaeosphaeria minitans]